MRLLLIKLGKAWHTLQREGLWRGGRRLVSAGAALFARVPPGDILFITGGVGDSARYRTRHVAEELAGQGLRASVVVQDNPCLRRHARAFGVVIFHRVLVVPRVAALLADLKQAGKPFLFETDDLVYDPQYLRHMDYYHKMNAFERRLYENGVGGEILRDPALAACTTTTPFLAEKLQEFGKPVFIVPNRLAAEDVRVAERLMSRRRLPSPTVRIGYFSGTASHDKDFATITDPLLKLLAAYPEVRLVIAGPLTLDARYAPFGARIERLPFVDRRAHFANLAEIDINLAPLEMGNPFCEAKSELKFLEAGVVGVPTVATATGTFCRALTSGEDGFVAATDAEWYAHLVALVTSPEDRRRMGARARETVLKHSTTAVADNKPYYAFLRQCLRSKEFSKSGSGVARTERG